jgi:lipopolysaccharide transport system ATP-binding protein
VSKIIQVTNLSKSYIIRHEGQPAYTSFRDVITAAGKNMFLAKSRKASADSKKEKFWALRDLNFEVEQGDRVGIIGRNGAGKSTLLKVLSRITEPTEGRVVIDGRIASLLEVGTGFHPELTGRENVFLNGAILGMSRSEIRQKFDEIIEFAGVERFLDTPVKHYSSGMYVRLAFSVAAHLEPEILVVDEVLAVGDAEFQRKCLGKMQEVSKQKQRTVFFVSHNMAAIKSLCSKVFVLEKGSVRFVGDPAAAVTYYLKGDSQTQNRRLFADEYDKARFQLQEIAINPKGGTSDDVLEEYHEIELNTVLKIKENAENLHFTYVLSNESGDPLFTFSHVNANKKLKAGTNYLRCSFPKGFLNIGTFYLSAYLIENARDTIFVEKDIMSFSIQESNRNLGQWMGREPGFIKPLFDWELK